MELTLSDLNRVPVLRLIIPFVAGILFSVYVFEGTLLLSLLLIPPGLILLWFYKIANIRKAFALQWLFGITASFIMFLLGHQVTYLATERQWPDHFINKAGHEE